jgi:hypothetical protein
MCVRAQFLIACACARLLDIRNWSCLTPPGRDTNQPWSESSQVNTAEYFDRIAKGVRGIEEEVRAHATDRFWACLVVFVCVRVLECTGRRENASPGAYSGIDFDFRCSFKLISFCQYISVIRRGRQAQAFAVKNAKDVEEGLQGAKVEDGQAVVDILRYIVHECSSEKEYPNGIRDKGRGSVTLRYFLDHDKAKV